MPEPLSSAQSYFGQGVRTNESDFAKQKVCSVHFGALSPPHCRLDDDEYRGRCDCAVIEAKGICVSRDMILKSFAWFQLKQMVLLIFGASFQILPQEHDKSTDHFAFLHLTIIVNFSAPSREGCPGASLFRDAHVALQPLPPKTITIKTQLVHTTWCVAGGIRCFVICIISFLSFLQVFLPAFFSWCFCGIFLSFSRTFGSGCFLWKTAPPPPFGGRCLERNSGLVMFHPTSSGGVRF